MSILSEVFKVVGSAAAQTGAIVFQGSIKEGFHGKRL